MQLKGNEAFADDRRFQIDKLKNFKLRILTGNLFGLPVFRL